MTWSFRFARVLGIDLKVHVTFVLIILFGAWQWGHQGGLAGALFGAALMVLLFVTVILHELGHSIAARAYGIPTKEIILLPIGGLSMLERMPRQPLSELVIALAGPFVNVVIAGLLTIVIGATEMLGHLDPARLLAGGMTPSWATLALWLWWANISLVLFNMVPAFPLDGGRVLRAALGFAMGYERATRAAAALGQLIAIALGLLGIFTGNLVLAFVALFIFVGAGSESAHARTGSILSRLTAGEAYNRYALRLLPSDSARKVADYVMTSYQPDFAVIDGAELVGVVTRRELVQALAAGKADASVAWIMRRDVPRMDARATLEDVRDGLVRRGERVAAIEAEGQFLGLVSLEDIAEAMLVIPYLRPPAPSAPGAGDGAGGGGIRPADTGNPGPWPWRGGR